MSSFARIAVNVPSLAGVFVRGDGESEARAAASFDYAVPERLEGKVGPGHLVIVPFANRTLQGVVLSLIDTPAVAKTKEILELVDPEPVLTAQQLALAEWMAATTTLSPLGAIIDLFLPPGLARQSDTVYGVRGTPGTEQETGAELTKRSPVEKRLMTLLQARGPLRGRQIDRSLSRVEWRRSAQSLVRRGVLSSLSVLPPASVRPKFIRTAQLAVPPESAAAAMSSLGSTEATQKRRQKALEFLVSRPEAINVSWVYASSGCNLPDLQELAERDLIVLREEEVWRDPLNKSGPQSSTTIKALSARRIVLTQEQQAAWEAIEAGFRGQANGEPVQPFLLQGVTGSGKTELYLRAAEEMLRAGREVIVLVPEISLTPQTVERFLAHFPGQVGLIHSKLSDGERYDTWRRARAGLLSVVIGPRSALFTPLSKLGLIVVDECHDASYYQAEPPFYQAVTAAEAYAGLSAATCILGSATPTVVQRYATEIGGAVRLELTRRVAAQSSTSPAPELDLPQVQVVDLREELRAGNRSSFSRLLTAGMGEVLRRGEQAILFLNRRGTATHVFCRNCGYVVRCPRCDTPLTYHTSAGEQLVCHRCGYQRGVPKKCPECGSTDIRAYGLGTERVEAEIQKAFPKARTLRWDWETTRQRDAHEVILNHFAAGRADILVGTQMLAKGLDLPRVTLVGIVMADVGLYLPDPFAAERVFQVLTQVAGRAGRSALGGRVVLQTYSPQDFVIQSASRHDVDGFYAHELSQRRRLGYPPFARLLRLEYRHYDPLKAEDAARAAAASLQVRMAAAGQRLGTMIGPAPCFFSKLDGKYRWQIVVRGTDFRSVLEGQRLPGWRIEVDPASLL